MILQLPVEKWKSIFLMYMNGTDPDSDAKELSPKSVHQTLKSSSATHSAKKVVLQDTLLQDVKELNGFHHTGSLEVPFLAAKILQHFSYDGMQAHIKLAILDHNYITYSISILV